MRAAIIWTFNADPLIKRSCKIWNPFKVPNLLMRSTSQPCKTIFPALEVISTIKSTFLWQRRNHVHFLSEVKNEYCIYLFCYIKNFFVQKFYTVSPLFICSYLQCKKVSQCETFNVASNIKKYFNCKYFIFTFVLLKFKRLHQLRVYINRCGIQCYWLKTLGYIETERSILFML